MEPIITTATTTCENIASGSICQTIQSSNPSSTILTANGFTYGEATIVVELFLIFAVLFYAFIWWSVGGIKVRPKKQ